MRTFSILNPHQIPPSPPTLLHCTPLQISVEEVKGVVTTKVVLLGMVAADLVEDPIMGPNHYSQPQITQQAVEAQFNSIIQAQSETTIPSITQTEGVRFRVLLQAVVFLLRQRCFIPVKFASKGVILCSIATTASTTPIPRQLHLNFKLYSTLPPLHRMKVGFLTRAPRITSPPTSTI